MHAAQPPKRLGPCDWVLVSEAGIQALSISDHTVCSTSFHILFPLCGGLGHHVWQPHRRGTVWIPESLLGKLPGKSSESSLGCDVSWKSNLSVSSTKNRGQKLACITIK